MQIFCIVHFFAINENMQRPLKGKLPNMDTHTPKYRRIFNKAKISGFRIICHLEMRI